MNYKKSIKESGKAGAWILLLILAISITVGLKAGKVYFDNAALKSEVEEMSSRFLLEPRYDLMTNVIDVAAQFGVYLKPADVHYKVNENGDQIDLFFDYEQVIDLYAMKYPMQMSVNVTKEMAKAKNTIQKFQDDYNSAAGGQLQEDYDSGARSSSQKALIDIKKKLNSQ